MLYPPSLYFYRFAKRSAMFHSIGCAAARARARRFIRPFQSRSFLLYRLSAQRYNLCAIHRLQPHAASPQLRTNALARTHATFPVFPIEFVSFVKRRVRRPISGERSLELAYIPNRSTRLYRRYRFTVLRPAVKRIDSKTAASSRSTFSSRPTRTGRKGLRNKFHFRFFVYVVLRPRAPFPDEYLLKIIAEHFFFSLTNTKYCTFREEVAFKESSRIRPSFFFFLFFRWPCENASEIAQAPRLSLSLSLYLSRSRSCSFSFERFNSRKEISQFQEPKYTR